MDTKKTGFNTTGNNNTENRTGFAVALDRTRSTSRIFNYCNRRSPSLDYSLNCSFNKNFMKKRYNFYDCKIKFLNIYYNDE